MSTPNQHEEALFQAALNLPPKDRDAYLDEACGEDAQLRGRIFERLFQADRTTRGASDESPTFPPTSPPTAMGAIPFVPEPSGSKPGERIGRYRILERIGEGGCGVVYVAEQEQPVRRRVALKVIKLGMDTRQVIARFEAERQALALMDHPNIAKVLDGGATESGRPFFVMELV
jgi:serine/threonine protein kinase